VRRTIEFAYGSKSTYASWRVGMAEVHQLADRIAAVRNLRFDATTDFGIQEAGEECRALLAVSWDQVSRSMMRITATALPLF